MDKIIKPVLSKLGSIKTSNSGIFYVMIFICCILAAGVLRVASSVILPLVIAVLLSFVMYPMVRWLNKRRVPNFLSILLVVIILVLILCIFGVVLLTTGVNILSVFPEYEERATDIYRQVAEFFELSFDAELTLWENIWEQMGSHAWGWVGNFALSSANIFLNFLTNAILIILFIVFILAEANFFKEKLERTFKKRSDDVSRMGKDVMAQVSRYLTAKFFISLANGIIYAIAFSLIGLEFAILWGIIQFVLNFIPNLGSIAAGTGISLFALIQFWPEPGPVIMVIAVVLVVNLILCNIFDPKIVGDRVGISPLVVLVSLVAWGWIWGFAGMVLAVPMTVIIKIICANIPVLKPVSILLGSRKSLLAIKIKPAAEELVSENPLPEKQKETEE